MRIVSEMYEEVVNSYSRLNQLCAMGELDKVQGYYERITYPKHKEFIQRAHTEASLTVVGRGHYDVKELEKATIELEEIAKETQEKIKNTIAFELQLREMLG